MAEPGRPLPRPSALGDLLADRQPGPEARPPMVHLSEPGTRVLWQIAAWRAAEVGPLRAIAVRAPGHDPARGPRGCRRGRRGRVPGRPPPLVADRPAGGRELSAGLADALVGRAALTDLSHARTVLRLAGPASRSTLAKLCRIDLHRRRSRPDGSRRRRSARSRR